MRADLEPTDFPLTKPRVIELASWLRSLRLRQCQVPRAGTYRGAARIQRGRTHQHNAKREPGLLRAHGFDLGAVALQILKRRQPRPEVIVKRF